MNQNIKLSNEPQTFECECGKPPLNCKTQKSSEKMSQLPLDKWFLKTFEDKTMKQKYSPA